MNKKRGHKRLVLLSQKGIILRVCDKDICFMTWEGLILYKCPLNERLCGPRASVNTLQNRKSRSSVCVHVTINCKS